MCDEMIHLLELLLVKQGKKSMLIYLSEQGPFDCTY